MKDSESLLNTWLDRLLPLFVAGLFVAAWQVTVWLSGLPKIILPSPSQVGSALIENWETLWRGALATICATLFGLGSSILVGTAIAILFSQSRRLRKSLYPYVIFLQTVPIVAIAPLLIIWSGYEFRTVVLVAVIVSIFPIIANVTVGLTSIDPNLRDYFRLQRASRMQTLLKLRVPAAVGSLIVGMRISCGLAVIGAIIGEYFIGSGASGFSGLGSAMSIWQSQSNTPALMAAVLMSTGIGVLFFSAINFVSKTILFRWTQAAQFESH